MLPQSVSELYKLKNKTLPLTRLVVEKGERVAVVLLSRGFPTTVAEQDAFYLKGIKSLSKFRKFLPDVLLTAIARKENATLIEECGDIESLLQSFGALKKDVQKKLEIKLNKSYPQTSFKLFNAQLFSAPSCASVVTQIQEEGISKVVVLPLYPQYSQSNSATLMQEWLKASEHAGFQEICIPEFANHPKFIEAFSERIGEAFQRFPKAVREEVAVIFTACSIPQNDAQKYLYTQLIQQSIDAILQKRKIKTWRMAFLKPVLFGKYFHRPWTIDAITELAKIGHKSILIVPISYLFDHFDTSYMLDVRRRQTAESAGVRHYEVMNGLNSHPLLIEALCEIVRAQLRLNGENGALEKWESRSEKVWIREWISEKDTIKN